MGQASPDHKILLLFFISFVEIHDFDGWDLKLAHGLADIVRYTTCVLTKTRQKVEKSTSLNVLFCFPGTRASYMPTRESIVYIKIFTYDYNWKWGLNKPKEYAWDKANNEITF